MADEITKPHVVTDNSEDSEECGVNQLIDMVMEKNRNYRMPRDVEERLLNVVAKELAKYQNS